VKLLIAIVALAIAGLAFLLIASSGTAVTFEPPPKAIGTSTPVKVKVDSPHGVRDLVAWVEQGGERYQVFEQHQAAHRWTFWRGPKQGPREFSFAAGKDRAPALKDGKAKVIVAATANDFRANTHSIEQEVEVSTQPPRVMVDEFQHYINQGGSELVTFVVSGSWNDTGVQSGKYAFRSWPMPGKPETQRFSLFGYPWDVPADVVPRVYAHSAAGIETTGRFWFKIFPKKFRVRDLDINDAFLDKVVNQIDPGGTTTGGGDLLQRFLKINGELRRKNNQTLADLRLKTEPRVLWNGPFLQLANSKVESQFADVRNYIYKGKKVDQQVHLGFDLSVTQHVPVVAANDGKVVWASDLGIYGNCIVVDHGYGLQSIYGHLSQIDLKPGDLVKKSQSMGKSGSTGLAGGDHLHFSMQLDGVQINPVEWFDDHWIHDRILSKLPAQ